MISGDKYDGVTLIPTLDCNEIEFTLDIFLKIQNQKLLGIIDRL